METELLSLLNLVPDRRQYSALRLGRCSPW